MKKKYFGIIGVALVVVLLIVGASIKPKENKDSGKELSNDTNVIINNAEQESVNASNDPSSLKELNEIRVSQYIEYYNSPDARIILVARPTCHYCQIAEPILRKIAFDYNLEINYVNIDNFEGDDASTFMASNEIFSEGISTPKILIVSNSQIIDQVNGLTDTAHYVEFFKENNFIK